MVSRYVTNGPVKQEGLCIMPPPPTHYRMMPPQRADAAFHVTPPQQPYAPPPPNQTGNQGPALRGMAPTGPPNQASTPPNSELKVPQMSQSVNLAFVSPQVRGGTQGFFGRPPPQNQPPRMPNHRIQGQQPVFPPQSAPFMPPVAQVQPIYCMSYYGTSTSQRPTLLPQYFPGQTFTTIYPQTPQQTQTYLNYPQYLPRGSQPQVVAPAPQNLQQVPPPTLPLAPVSQQQLGQQKKRRAKAIPIIDPESGKDKLDEIYICDDSHPASGESSARQTPQPQYIPNKDIQNTFNKQVNMVMNQDKMDELEQSSSPSLDQHLDTQQLYQTLPPAPQAVHISNRIELVQSSKLQLPAKEFIPAATHSNAAKEMTPVVSANVVAAEVTINKQNRESPAKNRKPRDPQGAKELKEPPTIVEKRDDYKIIIQDEPKAKETTLPPVPPTTVSSKETKEANNQREEKKNQKKDKVEQKLSVSPSSEIILENISQQNSLPPPAQENGKSKSKNKDAPKSTQAPSPMVASNHKQNTPIPVPQTQPAKPNNKTNKNRELNMKGANKEGTDMDAFSDNALQIDTVVVTNTNATTNDALNANDIINVNDSNKKIESNEVSTIKSESKSLPKKIDVTDIVKDVPKPFVAPVEACDETDRIEYDNDKIVQAKNEANTKVTVENDSNIIELRPSLPYKDDQWSPSNTAGKKIYDKEFLLALRNDPKSRQKPDNLLDVIAQEDRGKVGDISRYPLGGKTTDFAPTFSGSNYAGKSNSTQRSTLPKQRNSQQGKSGGSAKGGKGSNVIRSISVRGDVKLNESENAWKPARFISSANMSDDEKKTQELYKRVRGVLNKLTPQKFETLLHQVRSLTIDTKERLQGVIDLVFEKAVDEPNFSVAYALMCKELALMEVPANVPRKDGDSVNFRKLLVTRCQLEFEKNSVDETARNAKVKEIEECTDPEKKKELQLLLEDDDRRIRRKSVGNIRFIGELFKQNMLTVNIMMRCLHHLLENKEEESLECLCKLLATVGKEVEKRMDLNTIFSVIREIVDRKHGKISSRVRFMLQDVIDLRNSKWIPRRQDINPRTIDEIQKEASDEQLTIQALNAVPMTPRKDDRSVPGSGSGKRGTRNTSDQEGWSTASSRGRTPFSVQSDKLKNKPPQIDEPLGSSQMFGTWMRGSNIKTNTPTPPMGNMYAALENIGNDVDKRSPMNYSSKDPYHSKGTSLERNFKHSFEDGRGSRSGSQHRPHDSQRSKPMPTNQQNIPKSNPPATTKPRQPSVEQMTPECVEQIERKIKNILEEYLNDCYSVDECDDDIRTSLPPTTLTKLVSESYICVLDRSKTARLGTGSLFANLLKRSTLSVDNYCFGLEEVLSQADDLTIDIPKIWDYLAEIIAPIINENAVPLKRLHKSFDILIKQGHASKLLDPLFKLVITEKGPNYLHNQWEESNLKFSDFMEPSQVNTFIQENQFEFLLGGSNTVVGQSELTYEQIHKKLLEFFANDNSLDDIFRWIEATVGERAHEKLFVRTLATAVFEDSIVKSKLKAENLRKHYSLLIRIVDGRLDYELECLYALQALINRLEHPQGILLSICGSLYDDSVFSHDGFVKWETSDNPAEQEGKGVALKQLTSFFTQLKEADEETSSIEDA